jgi:hypothetical protein
MSKIVQVLLGPTGGPRSVLLVRIAVGLIFFTQGLLKYIDPNMGVVRFTRIGFPHPYFTAHFVGAFEILCGLLLPVGRSQVFRRVPGEAVSGVTKEGLLPDVNSRTPAATGKETTEGSGLDEGAGGSQTGQNCSLELSRTLLPH